MKVLRQSDLEIGDILIFENQDFNYVKLLDELRKDYFEEDPKKRMHAAFYLLLYMIPWFDPGKEGKDYKNIYHAAIWGNVNIYRGENREPKNEHRIVQAGTHGIGQAALEATLEGEGVKNIYVYRKTTRSVDFEDKVNNAIWAFYDDASLPYSYETAWLLAVICSMRYTDGALREMLEKHLGEWGASKMIEIILSLINQYNDDHQDKMIACSTLVAMIYKNAGFELDILPMETNPVLSLPNELKLSTDFFHQTFTASVPLKPLQVKETVVTPRQLAESPDVELVGILPHVHS
ncbi:hypothetical protein EV198_3438 [Roseivirga ehrenbergii]|uniref:Uncharacterized protein n=1 Tax=Roseivirga ehrenbergii (strain DSM 102268 / JCM 13514 / KCTC 12282 / NCIMB 14502 / KMM 6017) TaxID=279360 RepID=A0A150WY49_ROSEK|nr:hypothetical protein [Roseivirga ehrenbergii]KYG71346.1 hypothetical protein MB14_11255 [Roseivirga ehrenbergii]TCK99608.1 hypothetical protein EV198_3438 [Roseivirga ehrenbergii]